MNKKKSENKILIGVKDICSFLDNMSEVTFRKWVRRGLPVRLVDGRVYAHTENIEDYFKEITMHKEKDIITDVESVEL